MLQHKLFTIPPNTTNNNSPTKREYSQPQELKVYTAYQCNTNAMEESTNESIVIMYRKGKNTSTERRQLVIVS